MKYTTFQKRRWKELAKGKKVTKTRFKQIAKKISAEWRRIKSGKLANVKKYVKKNGSRSKSGSRASSRGGTRRKMAKRNGMFSNSTLNRSLGAVGGAALPRIAGAATPYVALAAVFLPKMPTALKVAGTVWAGSEVYKNYLGGNRNG